MDTPTKLGFSINIKSVFVFYDFLYALLFYMRNGMNK